MKKSNYNGDLDETGMFIQPNPVIKPLKAYGNNGYVCYKHKGICGAAAMSFGSCEVCGAALSSGCGGVAKLCNECSMKLSECKHCRSKVQK